MEYTKEGCPLRRSEGVAVSPQKFWEGRVAENRAFRVPLRWAGEEVGQWEEGAGKVQVTDGQAAARMQKRERSDTGINRI